MKRPPSHVTGDEAVRLLIRRLPPAWICREVPKDYGIDLEVELVDGDFVTGARLWFQVKGTTNIRVVERLPYSAHAIHHKSSIPLARRQCVAFPIDTAILTYALRCDFPVLLFVAAVETSEGYWLPLRDHIEMILDQQNPVWSTQKNVTLYIPTENCLSQEEERGFEGLRWYAMELPRTRAFAILSNYHRWLSLLCKDLRRIAETPEEIRTQRANLAPQFSRAMSYLARALDMECLFGSRGVDFFHSTLKPNLHSAKEAAIKAVMALEKGGIAYRDLRQLAACVCHGIADFLDCSFTYQALRRRFLFSDERCLSEVLKRDRDRTHVPDICESEGRPGET